MTPPDADVYIFNIWDPNQCLVSSAAKTGATDRVTKIGNSNCRPSVILIVAHHTTTEISYNEQIPDDCKIVQQGPQGLNKMFEREGSRCSKNGIMESTSYTTDANGCVTREKSYPGACGETGKPGEDKTVVNKDGSTDDYIFIYNDESGQPVSEHVYTPGKG